MRVVSAALAALLGLTGAAAAGCNGSPPSIGMTKAELAHSCWSVPTRTVKKTTAAGTEETYFFPEGQIKFVADRVAEIVEVTDTDPSTVLQRLKRNPPQPSN